MTTNFLKTFPKALTSYRNKNTKPIFEKAYEIMIYTVLLHYFSQIKNQTL